MIYSRINQVGSVKSFRAALAALDMVLSTSTNLVVAVRRQHLTLGPRSFTAFTHNKNHRGAVEMIGSAVCPKLVVKGAIRCLSLHQIHLPLLTIFLIDLLDPVSTCMNPSNGDYFDVNATQ